MIKKNVILSILLVILTLFCVNSLNAQETFSPEEKKIIIDKYKNSNNTFHPSPSELKVIYNFLKNQDAKETDKSFWENNKRLPNREKNEQIENQSKIGSGTLTTLPADARFPGEFEELQGVFVNYPYGFDGISIAENQDGSPSTAKFFRDLVNAIQQAGVKAYISIRDEIDKDILIQYFNDKGTPLSNYQFLVNPTNSIWSRDFGPIDFYYGDDDKIGWVDLNYYAGRELDDDLTPIWAAEFGIDYTYLPMEFEGGNILMNGQQTMTTSSRIYTAFANNSYTESEINEMLINGFNLDNLYVLDELEDDGGTAHIDLYIDMINENSFVYTKQPSQMANITNYTDYQDVLDNIEYLKSQTNSAGVNNPYMFSTVPFPTRDDGSIYNDASEINSTNRTYSNHLIINKTIIQPVFNDGVNGNITGDEASLDILRKRYPGYNIITIDGRRLEGSGGSVHCVTKEFHAENPIRFKHYQYSNQVNFCDSNYPVEVTITNKSGISQATLYSRVKGTSAWNQTNMVLASNNLWQSAITLTTTLNNETIEYYISATSDNGKTMTLPMTAAEGGAYTFRCTSSCSEVVNTFPYNESFENSLGDWTQETNDDIDWIRNTNGTPSNGTGPSSATDGNYYLYVEASSNVNPPGTPNKQAILKSPCFDLSSASFATFSFKYHIYGGNDIGNISLEATDDNGATWTKVWEKTSDQGNQWLSVDINLFDYVGETVQLRFNRYTGSNNGAWKADIAIDAISLITSDTQAPTAPTLSVSDRQETTASLSWSDSIDDFGVTGYKIYKNSQYSETVTNLSTTVYNLTPNTTYSYTITAVDAAGNESPHSNEVLFTTFPDTTPPTAPTSLSVSEVTETKADLAWHHSSDNVDVVAYNIYENGEFVYQLTNIFWPSLFNRRDNLTEGTDYVYKVTAVDEAGNESAFSNEVSFTTLGSSNCTEEITSFPYNESFENSLGTWTQSTDDDIDWLRIANGTPSNGTGPSSATDGNYYLYVEASANVNPPGTPNKQAISYFRVSLL